MTRIPAISVLMPVYNAGQYLQLAIDSILHQTCGDFELLLVDDGSTDGSIDVIRRQTDPHVRVLLRPHEGLVATLNFGLTQARAPLVARMDSDDLSLPHRLEAQLDYLRRHDEVVLLGTAVQRIDGAGNPIGPPLPTPLEHDDILWRLTRHSSASGLHHPSVMYRRQAVLDCGKYRTPFTVCEDWDLWVRLARVGKLHALAEPLLLLRKHGGNVTVTKLDANLQGFLRALVCHAVWERTGVDPVDSAPVPWRRAEERIAELVASWDLLAVLQARVELRQGLEAVAASHPWTVIGRLLRRPRLVRGLRFHRLKDRLIRQVTDETVEALVQADRKGS